MSEGHGSKCCGLLWNICNDIIENLRSSLQVAEERVRRLQDSEYKLECEIEELKQELSERKESKKIINKSNHILSYIQGTN